MATLSHWRCFVGILVVVFPFISKLCGDMLFRQTHLWDGHTWCAIYFTQHQLRMHVLLQFAVKLEFYHQPSSPVPLATILNDEGEELAVSNACLIVQYGLRTCLRVPASWPGFERPRLALAANALRFHRGEEVPHFLAVDGARRGEHLCEGGRLLGVDVGVVDEFP